MKSTYKFNKRWVFIIPLIVFSAACKKAVEVAPPVTSLVSATVFNSNATASSAVTGIFISIASPGSFFAGGSNGVSADLGMAADELSYYGNDPISLLVYENAQVSTNYPQIWSPAYNYIYQANAAIEGLAVSTQVTPAMKQQLTGEAKFIRAFCHFYLVNLYGDVPLVTTTNYVTNTNASRTPAAQVYAQIIQDLKDAQAELSDNYLDGAGLVTADRIRPNKAAATALLARVYLYTGDWADAGKQASVLIANNNYSLVSDLNSVFLANSKEAIWQLLPLNPQYNTNDGYSFILNSAPAGSFPFTVSPGLLNAFETGDQRKADWIGSYTDVSGTYYFPYKYKVKMSTNLTEYMMLFRLAEQYLISAEAKAELGDATAINDLNVIRNRAGLPNYSGKTDKASLLTAIYHERQVELFTEWGQRWLDLKRTGTVNAVMTPACALKGGTWSAYKQLFPIPRPDIIADSRLMQNPGY